MVQPPLNKHSAENPFLFKIKLKVNCLGVIFQPSSFKHKKIEDLQSQLNVKKLH